MFQKKDLITDGVTKRDLPLKPNIIKEIIKEFLEF